MDRSRQRPFLRFAGYTSPAPAGETRPPRGLPGRPRRISRQPHARRGSPRAALPPPAGAPPAQGRKGWIERIMLPLSATSNRGR